MSHAPFHSQAMALSFDNWKMLGMAEKFSGLRILAFALSGPTLGWAGLGGAVLGFGGHVISTLAPQATQQGSFLLPPYVCSLIRGPAGWGWWKARKAALGLECIRSTPAYVSETIVRSQVTAMWQSLLPQSTFVSSKDRDPAC